MAGGADASRSITSIALRRSTSGRRSSRRSPRSSEPAFEDKPDRGAVSFYRVAAVDRQGVESPPSRIARSQPRVMRRPVVSVLAPTRIEVAWDAHPAADVAGYNVYRGVAWVDTVRKGEPSRLEGQRSRVRRAAGRRGARHHGDSASSTTRR